MIVQECLYCHKKKLKEIAIRKDKVNVLKCLNCGLIMRGDMPENLEQFYGEDYYRKAESESNDVGYENYLGMKYFEYYFLARYSSMMLFWNSEKRGDLLDIGCANGSFLEIAREGGWNVQGLEISEFGATETRKKGIKVINGPFPETRIKGKFDVVTAWDVVEHVIDIEGFYQEINNLLKDGGLFIYSTGEDAEGKASDWLNYNASLEHIFYPTRTFMADSIKKSLGYDSGHFSIEYGGYAPLLGFFKKGKLAKENMQVVNCLNKNKLLPLKPENDLRNSYLAIALGEYVYPKIASDFQKITERNKDIAWPNLVNFYMLDYAGEVAESFKYLLRAASAKKRDKFSDVLLGAVLKAHFNISAGSKDLVGELAQHEGEMLREELVDLKRKYEILKKGEEWLKNVVEDQKQEIESIKKSRAYKTAQSLSKVKKWVRK